MQQLSVNLYLPDMKLEGHPQVVILSPSGLPGCALPGPACVKICAKHLSTNDEGNGQYDLARNLQRSVGHGASLGVEVESVVCSGFPVPGQSESYENYNQVPFERSGPRPQCKLRPGLSHKITLVCEHDKLVTVESTVKLIKTKTELI